MGWRDKFAGLFSPNTEIIATFLKLKKIINYSAYTVSLHSEAILKELILESSSTEKSNILLDFIMTSPTGHACFV